MSSFTIGLFLMFFAPEANLRDDRDSLKASSAGDIMVIIVVLQLPPRLSESSRVSMESLYGMYVPLTKAEITLPRQLRLLLMFLHSSNCLPSAPLTLTFSDPARSTRLSFATFSCFPYSSSLVCFICSIVMIKTAWEREELSFILVLAVERAFPPIFISSIIYSGFTTAHSLTPCTNTPFFGSSLIFRFVF